MSHSRRLRPCDVRAVFHLVGECRELGADARAWRGHLAARASGLLHARVAFVGESDPVAGKDFTVAQVLDAGLELARVRALWLAYMRDRLYLHDPVVSQIYPLLERQQTRFRRQFIRDRDWYGSTFFNEYLRVAGIDDSVFSFLRLPKLAACSGLFFHRVPRERRYTSGDCRLLHLLHLELCKEMGRSLATARDPSPGDLSPRLRQLLGCLLEGDSEKQLAARLGLSRDTIHEYVRRVYRHFGVSTRPGLLAYFLRRSGLRLSEGEGGARHAGES